jgi:indole-3-glycerol phosphate synthase
VSFPRKRESSLLILDPRFRGGDSSTETQIDTFMFLEEIAAHVRNDLASRRKKIPLAALQDRPWFARPTRGFAAAVGGKSRRIIAEVKRASPSQGIIRADFDPVKIARDFSANGACALSVLTEEKYFQGSLDFLEAIKEFVALPVLRKDFIVDRYQIVEARSFGADAILLIVALLDAASLVEFLAEARDLALDALVEVHTQSELETALKSGARLLGINNRDLQSFEVKLETAERLLPLVPAGLTVVCESGFHKEEDLARIEAFGAHAFLIGEALMRAPHPGTKLKEMLGGGLRL